MTETWLPYGRQTIEDEDVQAVLEVLSSDWLTTGPQVAAFEDAFAASVGAEEAVAVANGTAALHLSVLAHDIGPGDEVIVPTLSFVASANCASYVGARPVFADVRDDTLTVDPTSVERALSPRTKAIVAVDLAGLPADVDDLRTIIGHRPITLLADACHAPGATYRGRQVGTLADVSTFSFHPVKHLTTAEGGMITTDDVDVAARLRRLRNHGIATDHRTREALGTFEYDMEELGFNYRLSDLACALGRAQLRRAPAWLARRREIAGWYDEALAHLDLRRPARLDDRESAWHLYAVRLPDAERRRAAFEHLRGLGIGVNVHYSPIHRHSYYRDRGADPAACPVAVAASERLLSLPMWPGVTLRDVDRVAAALEQVLAS